MLLKKTTSPDSLFPRYHQSRLVDKLSSDIQAYFADTGQIGKKYLVNHSAGSGKTLTISWLAERLHSLYKVDTSIKLVDMVFILTDRNNLDNNVRDSLSKPTVNVRTMMKSMKISTRMMAHSVLVYGLSQPVY